MIRVEISKDDLRLLLICATFDRFRGKGAYYTMFDEKERRAFDAVRDRLSAQLINSGGAK